MKIYKKHIGVGLATLLTATAAASVFAAQATGAATAGIHNTFVSKGSHRIEAEKQEHKKVRVMSLISLATALGTTVDAVIEQLDGGESVRSIIMASGMDEATIRAQLEASFEADIKSRLTRDVATGKLTEMQADEMLTNLASHNVNYGSHKRGGAPEVDVTASMNK